jgi:hypothetical protein
MPDQVVQVQWDLKSTADNTLQIALKFLQIATSDNVQPFALLACEKFGVTLPICRATRKEVEKEAHSKRDSVLLSFTKAMIKQGGGESITQLSSNVAGLNFLALAAALVSASGVREASTTIQHMMDHSAINKQTVPAEYHVLNILEVLEPRLVRMGFLEMCYTWDRWLLRHAPTRNCASNHYPSSTGVEKIIMALRSLLRIGDEEADSVVVTSYSCTSWTLAFIEWCMGVPPNICYEAGGVILAQPESPIVLVIPPNPSENTSMKVELFTTSKSLLYTFILTASRAEDDHFRDYQGMVTVKTHGQQILQELQSNSGFGLRAIRETMPYALNKVQQLLRPGLFSGADGERRKAIDRWYSETDKNDLSWICLLPEFFSPERLLNTMRLYLDEHGGKFTHLKDIPLGTTGEYYLGRLFSQLTFFDHSYRPPNFKAMGTGVRKHLHQM